MDRFRKLGQRKASYERLDNDSGFSEPESQPLTRSESEEDEDYLDPGDEDEDEDEFEEVEEFSWLVYAVFSLLGMAMLWSWYVLLSNLITRPSNMRIGTCSSLQGRTSRNASSRMTGS
jgi:hypothetical protein